MLASTTSLPPSFSLIRRASSMAISSKGLMTYLMLSVTIPDPSGFTRIVVSGSGTLLTVTRIFTPAFLLSCRSCTSACCRPCVKRADEELSENRDGAPQTASPAPRERKEVGSPSLLFLREEAAVEITRYAQAL